MKKFALSPIARIALAAPIACLAVAASAGPLDHPTMKEGFWTTHMVTVSNPGNKVMDGHFSVCHSHAFDEWNESRAKQPGCTTSTDTWNGNTRTVAMTCDIHSSLPNMSTTISTKSTMVMLSDTSVHSEAHSTYTPAFMGETTQTMTMDFTYAGACPSGVQPGDRVNTNGSIMHLWKH